MPVALLDHVDHVYTEAHDPQTWHDARRMMA
jgi:hypothetical protein